MVENKNNELGTMRIANEVLAIVAGIAAVDVEGVAAMSGGIAGGIAEMLGRKNLTKGVKIEEKDDDVIVDLSVVMEFDVSIPQVTEKVQQEVKDAIERVTGIKAREVNVNVQGINIPGTVSRAEEEEEEAEEE